MRRNNKSDDGSLELLLDTVCNMFGGIILISLLLVVILNTTVQSNPFDTPPPSADDDAARRDYLRQLDERLARMTEAAESRDKALEPYAGDGFAALAEQVADAEERKGSLKREHEEIEEGNEALNGDISDAEEAAAESDEELDALLQLKRSKELKLADTRARVAKVATIPKLGESIVPRTQMSYVLIRRRLYGPVSFDAFQPNTTDFQFPDNLVVPRPEAGLPIKLDGGDRDAIESKLQPARRKRAAVVIFVYDDSFREYDSVRRVLEDFSIRTCPELVISGTDIKRAAPVERRYQ